MRGRHDHQFGTGSVNAVFDVLSGQQVGGGHGNHANFHRAKQGVVPLNLARNHDKGEITLSRAEPQQHVREPVRGRFEIAIGVMGHARPGFINFDDRCFVGIQRARPHHVKGKVKIFGNVETEIATRLGVVKTFHSDNLYQSLGFREWQSLWMIDLQGQPHAPEKPYCGGKRSRRAPPSSAPRRANPIAHAGRAARGWKLVYGRQAWLR